ncbi:hypothetical protein [uncultured Kordia sp.]|uniref:hypothetical protein n=1 Tax=uncultured Kordia sp. TaxID=507699 RepID=UPI002604CF4D|nr:hypothetical protein [uncultured Kordia sp.]
MAEELYFFKIDQQKVTQELIPLLQASGSFSFQNFIKNSDTYTRILENMNADIKKNQMDDFFTIWDWFYKKARKKYPEIPEETLDAKVEMDMEACGFMYFNEIPSKTPVRKFHEILVDYEASIDKEIDFISTKNELEDFLNYLICYAGELCLFLNRHYYKNDELETENVEIKNAIRKINRNDNYFHKLALSNLKHETAYYIETVEMSKKLTEFRKETMNQKIVTLSEELTEISRRESDLLNKAGILYYGIGLKKDIKNFEGLILRLHSY